MILKARECLREVLKTEASIEAKGSQFFEYDMLCVFVGTNIEEIQFDNVVIKDEGRGQNLSFVLEEDETVESHANTLTQRRR